MGGSRLQSTRSCRAALVLIGLIVLVVSLAGARAPGTNRRSKAPTDRLQLSQRAEEPALYVVYPKDPANKSQTDAISKLLNGFVSDKTKIYASESKYLGIFFWSAPLTKSQAAAVKANSDVGAVGAQCTDNCYDPTLSDTSDGESALEKRDGGLVKQQNAAPEMVFVSTPEDLQHGRLKDYVYDRTAGTGQTVYICDYGAHLDNPEFRDGANLKEKARWLFAKGMAGTDTKEDDASPSGHGSCMLDKIGGNKFGVAKKVSPVIVKIPYKGGPEGWLDSVRKVYDDFKPKYDADPKHATAVLSMSWAYPESELEKAGIKDRWLDEFKGLLQRLVGMGVLPVTGSGNARGNTPVDKYPQLWAAKPSDVPELLVVGGVTNEGKLWDRSQVADFVKVHAPSFKINCADGKGGLRNPEEVTGTSIAGATVAGLAAYFSGLSSLKDELRSDVGKERVKLLRSAILAAAWPRDAKVYALWNLADPRQCEVIKRDDGVETPCDSAITKPKNTASLKTATAPSDPIVTKPAPVPLASQCIHVFTAPPQHTATCTTSISKSDLSTPLPNLAWTCLSSGLFRRTCYCQAENQPQPCVPPTK